MDTGMCWRMQVWVYAIHWQACIKGGDDQNFWEGEDNLIWGDWVLWRGLDNLLEIMKQLLKKLSPPVEIGGYYDGIW